MKAIKETGNNLLAAIDPHDSVGVLDSYFPEADFFTEFERFDRHCEKLKRCGISIDYVVVCSPNYLHDAHIRFGLRLGADVICEKPVVLNPWNVEALMDMEIETGKKVYCLLQLRYHPAILALQKKVRQGPSGKKYSIDLKYITARGKWYQYSWKGDIQKSGGVATNIGLHFFDMLLWVFGNVKTINCKKKNSKTISGELVLEQANVNWLLSVDHKELLEQPGISGGKSFRSLKINEEEISFNEGFEELHTRTYEEVLIGNGVKLLETLETIRLVNDIRILTKE